MCRIMAHAKIVPNLMGHRGSHTNGILRVVHADTSRLVHRAHSHEWGQANSGTLKGPARDQLCIVMALLGKQLAPPTKKGPKGRVGIL